MNVNALTEQGSRRRARLKVYGRVRALMAVSGSVVLLVLDVLEITQ